MTDSHQTRQGVDTRDMTAAADLLACLAARGTPVASILVTHDELVAETPPDVTPPQGIAVMRAIEDDPAAPVTVRRLPGKVDLIARVLARRVRLRVARGTH